MSNENEVKPKKRTGLVVFLTILVILLVAAISVLATLYFTDSDLLKFNKDKEKKSENTEVVEEEEKEVKTSKEKNKSSKEETKTNKTTKDSTVDGDITSLITGDKKAKTAKKKPIESSLFVSELKKYGIECEKSDAKSGVTELYIGYDNTDHDKSTSSASYIKFENAADAKEYYTTQVTSLVGTYSTTGEIKKDAGDNWENMRIKIKGSSSFIYCEVVDNVLIAISTDDATMATNIEKMATAFGY